MEYISIVVSIIALATALYNFWLTRFKKGTIKISRPTVFYFGTDASSRSTQKIYFKALLYSTSETGRYINNMFIRVRKNESTQNFNVWVFGDKGNLTRGSGLYINREGVATDHHFLMSPDSDYQFSAGEYHLEIFIEPIGEKPIKIFEQSLSVNKEHEEEIGKYKSGIYFDWAPNSQRYVPHIDRKISNPTIV